jgi:hypothetical protein
MTTIYVTNKTDKVLVDEYAFKQYKFPVNITVEVPIEVARHIFGYGSDNKELIVARLGFAKTLNDMPDGLLHLEKFIVSEEKPKQDRSLSPPIDIVPPPVPQGRVGRIVQKAA